MTRKVIGIVVFGVLINTIAISMAWAIEVQPTQKQIEEAIAKGQAAKDKPEALFQGYEFGKPGVEVNGYVLTKLFQIAHKAANLAKEGKAITPDHYKEILAQDYLLFPLYLVATAENGFSDLVVEMRQGIKTLKASEVLQDPPEKMLCEGAQCLWKKDVYAGFFYKDFDALRLAVLVVRYKGVEAEFPLVFNRIL